MEKEFDMIDVGTQTESVENVFYQPKHFIDSVKHDHTYPLTPHTVICNTRKLSLQAHSMVGEEVNSKVATEEVNKTISSEENYKNSRIMKTADMEVERNIEENPNKEGNQNELSFFVKADTPSIPNESRSQVLPNNCVDDELDTSLGMDTDGLDNSFHLSNYSESESESEDENDTPSKVVDERKFIIFESALDNLVKELRCELCGLRAYDIRKHVYGTAVQIQAECLEGHLIINWKSQTCLGKMAAGNLLCSAATLYSGETYSHIANWAKFLNLQFIGHTQFYEIQRDILVPMVNEIFEDHKKALKDEMNGNDTWFSGDARYDSPGYSAKYGSYSLMGQKSKKIITTQLVHVNEAGSSNGCEKEGFKRCLAELESDKIQIDLLATDRHPGITKFMDERKKEEYEYDLWHVTKSIKKDLSKKMKKKGCAAIGPWIKCITNHLWWASENCNGDVEKLKSDWLSLQYHIVNLHQWRVNGQWKECPHEVLSQEKMMRKKWLKPGSIAHLNVIEVISKAKLLRIFPKLTRACHTSELESFHSSCTKYCPKRQEFDYEVMDARMKLAVLDHNENVGRKQATISRKNKKFQDKSMMQWKMSCSKQTKTWSAKRVLEKKTYSFVHDLMVLSARMKAYNPLKKPEKLTKPANIPKNIAPVPMPSKEELIKKRQLQDEKQTRSLQKTLQNEIRVKEFIGIKNSEGAKNEDETAFQVTVKGSRRTECKGSIGKRASEKKRTVDNGEGKIGHKQNENMSSKPLQKESKGTKNGKTFLKTSVAGEKRKWPDPKTLTPKKSKC